MSDTSKTRTRRENKKRKMGQDKKKQRAKKGTTPKFPIHPDGKKKS